MAQKTDRSRKDKVNKFKEEAKQAAALAQVPKSYLVPQTNWETTDVLELRGDLLEALEKQMVLTYEALQEAGSNFSKAAQVMQMIMSTNVKAGKIKLTYSWNSGEAATESEVKDYMDKMAEIQKLKQDQAGQQIQNQNAAKTGLVTPEGEPLGSDQILDDEPDQPQPKDPD